MGDRVRAGKPSRYVASQLGRLSLLPSVQGRLSLSADGASEPWPILGGKVFKFILFILLVNLNNV